MLARPSTFSCIECGLPFGDLRFACYHGHPARGPAYYTDRGVLCSSTCSLAHHAKRRAEGTLPAAPPRNPMDGHFG